MLSGRARPATDGAPPAEAAGHGLAEITSRTGGEAAQPSERTGSRHPGRGKWQV